MHLDQLIRALQHPAGIDAAEAANTEVEFRTLCEDDLVLREAQFINGRICIDLRPPVPKPTKAVDDKIA